MAIDLIIAIVGSATAVVTAVGVWITAIRQKRSAQGFYEMPISARVQATERHNEVRLIITDDDYNWVLHGVRVRGLRRRRTIAKGRDGDSGRNQRGEYIGLVPDKWVRTIAYNNPIEARWFDTVSAMIILHDSVLREIKLTCTLSNNGKSIRKRKYPFVVDVPQASARTN